MKASETKERILEVAARLFHEQGYHATGISTILREADVNAGSLYHFFPSKEALLASVLEWYTTILRPRVMDPVEAKTKDPIERVFVLLDHYRRRLAPLGFAMGCPIGNLALELSDGRPDIRELVSRNFQGWAGVVKSWLDVGRRRLPRRINRGQLAQLVLTVMEGAVMQARAAGSAEPYDASVAQLRQYFAILETFAMVQRKPKKPRRRLK